MEKQVTLKPEKLEVFRLMLIQKINDLLGEAGKTVSEMTNGKENFPDPTDRVMRITQEHHLGAGGRLSHPTFPRRRIRIFSSTV